MLSSELWLEWSLLKLAEEIIVESIRKKDWERAYEIVNEEVHKIVYSLRKEGSTLSEENWERFQLLLGKRICADKRIAHLSFPIDEIIEIIMNIDSKQFLEFLKIDSELTSEEKELVKNSRVDVRNNVIDPVELRKCQRYTARSEILNLIRENNIEGLGKTQKEIAQELSVSVGLVNKISKMYKSNKNIKDEDVREKIYGRRPNAF